MKQLIRHLLFALVLMPVGACADLMYYYVNWTAADLVNNDDFDDVQAVVLYAKNGNTVTRIASLTKTEGTTALESGAGDPDMYWSDFYNSTPVDGVYVDSAYSFFVSAYKSETDFTEENLLFDGELGNLISSEALQQEFGAISDFVASPDPTSFWAPNLSQPTPEPSSGVLLWIGGAVLALRRRRLRGTSAPLRERRQECASKV